MSDQEPEAEAEQAPAPPAPPTTTTGYGERAWSCPACGHDDPSAIIPVWEDPADYDLGGLPDHLGCQRCGTMTAVSESADCGIHPTDFWCPWCEQRVTHECGYDHAYEHMDVAPYAVEVMDTFVVHGEGADAAADADEDADGEGA